MRPKQPARACGTQPSTGGHGCGNPHPVQLQGTMVVALGPLQPPTLGARGASGATMGSGPVPTFSTSWEGCGQEGNEKSAGCPATPPGANLPCQSLPPPALTSARSSLGGGRCRCRRSTSSISYTLISKGSFSEPARGRGRSTHCPGRLGLRPRAAVSGNGAGISRLRCRPGTEPGPE